MHNSISVDIHHDQNHTFTWHAKLTMLIWLLCESYTKWLNDYHTSPWKLTITVLVYCMLVTLTSELPGACVWPHGDVWKVIFVPPTSGPTQSSVLTPRGSWTLKMPQQGSEKMVSFNYCHSKDQLTNKKNKYIPVPYWYLNSCKTTAIILSSG